MSGQTPAECHRCELQEENEKAERLGVSAKPLEACLEEQRWLTHALLIQNVVWRFHVEESRCSFICLHAVLCT